MTESLLELYLRVSLAALVRRHKSGGGNPFESLAAALVESSPFIANVLELSDTVEPDTVISREEQELFDAIYRNACERARRDGREPDAGDLMMTILAFADAEGVELKGYPPPARISVALSSVRATMHQRDCDQPN